MTNIDPRAHEPTCDDDASLDAILATAHAQLGIAVTNRITAQGGPPELRTPDLALDRLLAAAHRSTKSAVTRRLHREAGAALSRHSPALETRQAARGSLSSRSPSVRVKYRREALLLARSYWPLDLAEAMREAIRIVQDLCDLMDDVTEPSHDTHATVDQLREHLRDVSRLPEPIRPPATLTGLDYLAAVEAALAAPAERFLHDLQNIQQLLDEELAQIAAGGAAERACSFGFDVVAQDFVDDLYQGCDQAKALAKAVAEVERASSDFVGADLSDAKLDGVLLEGILWDATTVWPAQWGALVRRASLPSEAEHGVLVIAAEPSGTMVHADA